MRWFITREFEDAHAECARLTEHGVDARPLPCVVTRVQPWPWSAASEDTWTIFTSRRAVESWLASSRPSLGRVAALAPVTSNLLREHHVRIELEGTEGVVELARALASEPGAQLRYPTSNAGIESHEQTEALTYLTHFNVDRRIAYELTTPPELAHAQLPADFGLAFFSPSAVKSYLSVQKSAPREVVCFGTSTASTWNSQRPSSWPIAVVTRDLHATLTEEKNP